MARHLLLSPPCPHLSPLIPSLTLRQAHRPPPLPQILHRNMRAPGPLRCPRQRPRGSFAHSHTVRGLLHSGLCALRPSLTTLWSGSPITLLISCLILCCVFVYCLPPLLECLLPEDSSFILVTGVPTVPGPEQVFDKYFLREWVCEWQMDTVAGRLEVAKDITSFCSSL